MNNWPDVTWLWKKGKCVLDAVRGDGFVDDSRVEVLVLGDSLWCRRTCGFVCECRGLIGRRSEESGTNNGIMLALVITCRVVRHILVV